MSIVLWDGKQLAVDSLAVDSGRMTKVKKYKFLPGGRIAAWVGVHAEGIILANWYEDGLRPDKWPEFQKPGEFSSLIILHPDGELDEFEHLPVPIECMDRFAGWGDGSKFALGALAQGADIVEAMRIACRLSPYCGGKIHVFQPGGPRTEWGSENG
jgi:hypothetical protein